ncbi:MAG: hypothetical protein JWO59_2917 [Chloroflexi bacterium]|nr:hypothetical protein [Chloroflexota bacterium]
MLDAFQSAFESTRIIRSGVLGQPSYKLLQDGEAHGEMEPVQDMLGGWMEIHRHLAHGLPAVRGERDLLVGLHALGSQQFEEPALGLGIEALYEGEALARYGCILWIVGRRAKVGSQAAASST